MTKPELALLEKAFEAEIEGALKHGPRLFQSKSNLAKKLVAKGYLVESEAVLGGRFPVRIKGYELTELGRLEYCIST